MSSEQSTCEMSTQSEISSPMWCIERELVTLRKNVEQELISGLREKLHQAILDSFANVELTPAQLAAQPIHQVITSEMSIAEGSAHLSSKESEYITTIESDQSNHSVQSDDSPDDTVPRRTHGSSFVAIAQRISQMSMEPSEYPQTGLARTVRSDSFDYFMGAILILNSVVIGLRADWEASNLGKGDLAMYVWVDRVFCVAFVAELSLRIYTYRQAFFTTGGWQWAYFDTVIVACQVFEEIMLTAARQSATNLGFLKIMKMARLLRMVRMVRLLPELKALVLLLLASMSSFVWTCVLLLLLVYILSVYMVMMAVDSLEQSIGQESSSRDQLQLYWGSVGSAFMSLYWSITGGEDWSILVGPLISETGNQMHSVVFSMYIAFATMVLMNLVTGVFVEGAARLRQRDIDRDLSKMARKVFQLVDDDSSKQITREEFDRHMRSGDMDPCLAAVDLDRSVADWLWEVLATDRKKYHEKTIKVHDFVEGCLRLKGPARSADVAQLLVETRKQTQIQKEWISALNGMMQLGWAQVTPPLETKPTQAAQPRKVTHEVKQTSATIAYTDTANDIIYRI